MWWTQQQATLCQQSGGIGEPAGVRSLATAAEIANEDDKEIRQATCVWRHGAVVRLPHRVKAFEETKGDAGKNCRNAGRSRGRGTRKWVGEEKLTPAEVTPWPVLSFPFPPPPPPVSW